MPVRISPVHINIPVRFLSGALTSARDDASEAADMCYICKSGFCQYDECCRTMTHLDCCSQPMCCRCVAKVCRRCNCKEDCDAVVSTCPFCRKHCPVNTLDIFLGGQEPCEHCASQDSRPAEEESDADHQDARGEGPEQP